MVIIEPTNWIALQNNGGTVLHYAVSKGHIEMVKILLSDKRFTEINAKANVSDNIILYYTWLTN